MFQKKLIKKAIIKDNLVFLAENKSFEKLKIDEIECIIADNIFTQIFFSDKKIIKVRRSLSEWEKILPQNIFIRINRATIINLSYVKHIKKSCDKTFIMHMKNYENPVTMSKSYSAKLKGKLII